MPVLANTPHADDRPSVPTPSVAAEPAGSNERPTRRPWLVGGAALLLLAAGTAALVSRNGDDGAAADEPVTLRAVEASVGDLVETSEFDATLRYADQQTVLADEGGLVTHLVQVDTTVERGDVIHEINAQPTPVFYGDLGFYRPLSNGSIGDDVEILEANLAALGYHTSLDADDNEIDTGFVVDSVFDDATKSAVEAWQEDLGIEVTGTVHPTDVVVTPGPALVVDTAVDAGDQVTAGMPLATLTVGPTVTTGHAAHAGEIEMVAGAGSTITSGDVIYTVDERPVIAIVVSDATELERDFVTGMSDGDDIEILEQTLVGLGYDAGGDLEVDDVFDDATAEAIEDWENDLTDTYEAIDPDGTVDLDDLWVVETDGPVVVGTHTSTDADVTASGTRLFTSTDGGVTRIVSTEIDVAEQGKLELGSVVDIELPDGSTVPGTVVDVASSSTVDPMDPTADPTLAVEISVTDIPEAFATVNELDVEVLIIDDLVRGATTVPASALLSLADGSFVVEVPFVDGSTQLVPVQTGMFADGVVEVTGIDPGTPVVIPS